jgi:hypothetical protein
MSLHFGTRSGENIGSMGVDFAQDGYHVGFVTFSETLEECSESSGVVRAPEDGQLNALHQMLGEPLLE